MNHNESIMDETRQILPELGWKTSARPVKEPPGFISGFLVKNKPAGLKELWLGVINNSHWQGVFVGATPANPKATKHLIKEGYKVSPSGRPQWFLKRLISEKNLKHLSQAPKREKTKILKHLIENTYPF